MLGLEVRGPFERHRPADMLVGGLDVLLREAEMGEEVESGIVDRLGRDLQRILEEVLAQGPLIEHELDVEGRRKAAFDLGNRLVRESLGLLVDRGAALGGLLRVLLWTIETSSY